MSHLISDGAMPGYDVDASTIGVYADERLLAYAEHMRGENPPLRSRQAEPSIRAPLLLKLLIVPPTDRARADDLSASRPLAAAKADWDASYRPSPSQQATKGGVHGRCCR